MSAQKQFILEKITIAQEYLAKARAVFERV